MIVIDLRNEFYDLIVGKRVVVLANFDVDGICAIRILQSLLKHDNVAYSLVPILGMTSMRRAYDACRSSTKHIVLINCGGCIDLVDYLQPESDAKFYVCDSRRPLDVCNVYSNNQVFVLLGHENMDEKIPSFETIFRLDEVSDGETCETTGPGKSQNKCDDRYLWEKERDRIMIVYTQYSYFGRSSSLVMFELAWKISRDSVENLWWAIVGNSEQLILGQVERPTHILRESALHHHISRLSNLQANAFNSHGLKITFEKDLSLILLRHWSIYESLKHTMLSACKLKLWTSQGEKKLFELLADLGIPLIQSKQLFTSVDLALRQNFIQSVENVASRYDMKDIVSNNYILQHGYSYKFTACDYVYAIVATMVTDKNSRPEDNFLRSLDCLSLDRKDLLCKGIEKAKSVFASIFKQVQISLEMGKVRNFGQFLYHDTVEESSTCMNPCGMQIFAQFLLNCYATSSDSAKNLELPLIHCCLVDIKSEVCYIVGIPPIKEINYKNYFGKAFEQAARQSGTYIFQDYFDKSVIQIKHTQKIKFLNALSDLIE